MSTQTKKKPTNTQTTQTNLNSSSASGARDLEVEAEVLFQKLYGKWYAFSVVEDDCLITEVSEEDISKRMPRRMKNAA